MFGNWGTVCIEHRGLLNLSIVALSSAVDSRLVFRSTSPYGVVQREAIVSHSDRRSQRPDSLSCPWREGCTGNLCLQMGATYVASREAKGFSTRK